MPEGASSAAPEQQEALAGTPGEMLARTVELLRDCRVLVADDVSMNRDVLCGLLQLARRHLWR